MLHHEVKQMQRMRIEGFRGDAPTFFRRDDDIGQSFVFRQPVTEEEIILCREALEGCPTESIGEE